MLTALRTLANLWGPSAKLAILTGCPYLCGRLSLSTLYTEASSHPFARAEDAFEQAGQVEISVKLGEIYAYPGRTNLDVLQIARLSMLKLFHLLGLERKFSTIAQIDND